MFLEVTGISKAYQTEAVLKGVSFTLEEQRTLSILGSSGCGKTTLLRIIAGLTQPDAGRVVLGGRDITDDAPQRRKVLYLYQEPLLFPHLNVYENVAFGLRLRTVNEPEIRRAVAEMLEHLDLTEHQKKMPTQISGGQRQRVAFGRALIVNPALLLLDEPFSSLDAETRAGMQSLFQRVARDYSITSLFVTHSLKEALLMGDVVAHIRNGALRTYSTKAELMADPDSGVAEELRFWDSLREEIHG